MNSVELPELMIATNIFGRGLGVKKIRIIMDAYPNILLEKETYDKKIEKISKLEGFKEKSAKKFVDHIVDFIKFININKLQYKVLIQNKKSIHISHPLNNKKIVITGFRNKQFENKLKNIGVKLMTSISKTTDLLIYNGDKKSSKLVKADNLNIKKIHLIEFINKYKMNIK
jgi:NAD-dependent DNA ligase